MGIHPGGIKTNLMNTLDHLSLIELKAMAYDTLYQLEFLQNNLAVLNTEIQKRINTPPAPIQEEKGEEKPEE